MELSDYNPTSPLDFELLIDRFVDANKVHKGRIDPHHAEEYLKELMLECFKIGYKAGQMPINAPIDLKKIAIKQRGKSG